MQKMNSKIALKKQKKNKRKRFVQVNSECYFCNQNRHCPWMSPTIENQFDDRFEEGIRLAKTTYVGP